MITRDNYEEFFLLYMDNELPVADRKLVEQFVAENRDLEEEWEALLQCRIQPGQGEQPVFSHKELLMKFEGSAPVGDAAPVNDTNYEDYFLSYIDGELNEREGVWVAAFVRLHPSKGLELEQLRQTISRPDPAIIFPDKESLYRKDRDAKIIFPWWRVAAAAVVLGAVGLLFFYPPKKEGQSLANGKGGVHAAAPAGPGSPALAETGPKKESDKKGTAPVTPATATALYSSGSGKKEKAADDRGRGETEKVAVAEKVRGEKPTSERTGGDRTTGDRMAMEGKSGERTTSEGTTGERTSGIARFGVEKITHQEGNAIAAADPGVGPGPAVASIIRPVASQEVVIPKEKSSFATQALLNNSTASGDDDDNFEAEPASTKKNKFRGIFRKVSRAFEKTADREDDGQRKVLIGAFQIALK